MFKKLLGVLAVVGFVWIVNPGQASALINNGGSLPDNWKSLLDAQCRSNNGQASQASWFSERGSIRSTAVPAPANGTTVNLQLNYAVKICDENGASVSNSSYYATSNKIFNLNRISGPSGTISGHTSIVTVQWGGGGSNCLAGSDLEYAVCWTPVTLSLNAPVTSSTLIRYEANAKRINAVKSQFIGGGTGFDCVLSGETTSSLTNFGPCSAFDFFSLDVDIVILWTPGPCQVTSNSTVSLYPGQSYTYTFRAQNQGDEVWQQGPIPSTTTGRTYLGTSSNFQISNGTYNGVTSQSELRLKMQQGSVGKNSYATFSWTVTAPSTPGSSYTAAINIVKEGYQWSSNTKCNIRLNVNSLSLPSCTIVNAPSGSVYVGDNYNVDVRLNNTNPVALTATTASLKKGGSVIKNVSNQSISANGNITISSGNISHSSPAGSLSHQWSVIIKYGSYTVGTRTCDKNISIIAPSLPTCSIVNAPSGSVYVGDNYNVDVSISNGNPVGLTASTSVLRRGSVNIKTVSNQSISANRSITIPSGNISYNSPAGNLSHQWSITVKYGNYTVGTRTCSKNISIIAPSLPTCTVINAPNSINVGRGYSADVRIFNSNPIAVTAATSALARGGQVIKTVSNQNIPKNSNITIGSGTLTYSSAATNLNHQWAITVKYGNYTVGTRTCNDSVTFFSYKPSCTVSMSTGSINVGRAFTANVTVRNDNGATMTIYSRNIVGQSKNQTWSTSTGIGGDSSATYSSGNIFVDTVGNYTYTWTINSSYGSTTCSGSIRTTSLPPTCTISASANSVIVGQNFTISATVRNPNGASLNTSNATFSGSGANSNPATDYSSVPGDSNRTFVSNQISLLNSGSYTYGFNVNTQFGNCNLTVRVTATSISPNCNLSVTSNSINVGQSFRISVSVQNQNFVALNTSNARFTGTGINATPATNYSSVPANSTRTFQSNYISLLSAGNYTYRFTVSTQYGNCDLSTTVNVYSISPNCNISSSLSRANVGQGFVISVSVQNQNHTSLNTGNARFYGSSINSTPVTNYSSVPALSTRVFKSNTITQLTPGNYTYRFTVSTQYGNCDLSTNVTVFAISPNCNISSSLSRANVGQGFVISVSVQNQNHTSLNTGNARFTGAGINATPATNFSTIPAFTTRVFKSNTITQLTPGNYTYRFTVSTQYGNCDLSANVTVFAIAPICNISATSNVVNVGQSYKIRTTVQNQNHVALNSGNAKFTGTGINATPATNFSSIPAFATRTFESNNITLVDPGNYTYRFTVSTQYGNCNLTTTVNVYAISPSCDLTATSTRLNVGQTFSMSVRVGNSNLAPMKINSASFSGQGVNSRPTNSFTQIGINSSVTYNSAQVRLVDPGTYTYSFTVSTPWGNCTDSVNIVYYANPPTCTVTAAPDSRPNIGKEIEFNIRIGNNNAAAMTVNSARLIINRDDSIADRDGEVLASWNGTIAANSTKSLSSGKFTNIESGRHSYVWSIETPWGNATCSDSSDWFSLPPLCSNWSLPSRIEIGQNFTSWVDVKNRNFARIRVTGAGIRIEGSNGHKATAATAGTVITATGNGTTNSPGGIQRFTLNDLSWDDPGTGKNYDWNNETETFSYTWFIETNVGRVECSNKNLTFHAFPPTCTASNNPATIEAGRDFTVSNTAVNPNDYAAIRYLDVSYVINGVRYNAAVSGAPNPSRSGSPSHANSLSKDGGRASVSDTTDITVPADADYEVVWIVETNVGDAVCSDDIEITVELPSCTSVTTSPFPVEVGSNFTNLLVYQNNNYIPIQIASARYSIESIGNGSAARYTNPVPLRDVGQAESPSLSYGSPGTYDVLWTVDSNLIDGNSPNGVFTCGDTGGLLRVVELPYFKVYGGDVSVGNVFGKSLDIDACDSFSNTYPTTARGRILGWAKGSGAGSSGSSVEYMARALGSIDMFYSASQRTSNPIPEKGLTLANTSGRYGGFFGQERCISNYWRGADTRTRTVSGSLNLASVADEQRVYSATGITLSDSGGDPNLNASIYVNGDIRITSNIINNRGNWNNREEVGAIYIVAKGDIFINSSVDEIDAVLVAIPRDDGSRGRVYTCRNTSNAASSAYPGYNTCNNKLTINGAVVAKELHLGRVGGTLRDASAREAGTSNNVAEVINFVPESFVAIPTQSPVSGELYKSDSLISLPPTL